MSDSYYEHPLSAGVGKPLIRNYIVGGNITPASTLPDEAIKPEALRWFRRDDLVRKCIVINAAFATLSAGFDTELEAVDNSLSDDEKKAVSEQFNYVKAYVDQVNRQVNLDKNLFIAQVKRSIFGQAAFEIVFDKKNTPSWLLSLQSDKLKPKVNSEWKLDYLEYSAGKVMSYSPEELLFFTNLQLENDYIGLSDVEPIFSQCASRRQLIKIDFPKITKRLWAPYSTHQVDTSLLASVDERQRFMDDLAAKAQSGESLIVNQAITSNVVDMHVDFTGLLAFKASLEQDIISNFGTPRFLLNRPTENRATSYTEFEAYIMGPIATIQRDLKRELEAQWYPRLVLNALKLNGYVGAVPVKVSQTWRTIRVSDIYQMALAASQLYGNGLGLLGEHPEIGYEMMGFDSKVLETSPESTVKEAPKTEDQKTTETVTQDGK